MQGLGLREPGPFRLPGIRSGADPVSRQEREVAAEDDNVLAVVGLVSLALGISLSGWFFVLSVTAAPYLLPGTLVVAGFLLMGTFAWSSLMPARASAAIPADAEAHGRTEIAMWKGDIE